MTQPLVTNATHLPASLWLRVCTSPRTVACPQVPWSSCSQEMSTNEEWGLIDIPVTLGGTVLRCVIHNHSEDPRGWSHRHNPFLEDNPFLAFFPSLLCFAYVPCFLGSSPKQTTSIQLIFQSLFFFFLRNLHSDKASIWYFPKVSLRNRGTQPLLRHPLKVIFNPII